jgi:hypothetical protein
VATIFAGIGLCRNWNTVHHRFTQVSAIVLATLATVLACGATAYVQLVRPLRAFDYSVEASGMMLSLLGTVLGLVTLRFPRWFSSLALGVSAWMLVWFFLLGFTY